MSRPAITTWSAAGSRSTGAIRSASIPTQQGLEPALELSSYVAAVKLARPGDSAGYGRRFIADRDTWIATIPIGYADGVNRALTNNCDVLIGGRRYPLAGTVSMDNITVELGPEPAVGRSATQVILIGRSGAERQTAEDVSRSGWRRSPTR